MRGRGEVGHQEIDGGQRYLRHSSDVANPAGGSSMGSLPSSSPGVGMLILAAHSASSSSDIGQVVCGASAWRWSSRLRLRQPTGPMSRSSRQHLAARRAPPADPRVTRVFGWPLKRVTLHRPHEGRAPCRHPCPASPQLRSSSRLPRSAWPVPRLVSRTTRPAASPAPSPWCRLCRVGRSKCGSTGANFTGWRTLATSSARSGFRQVDMCLPSSAREAASYGQPFG